MVIKVKYNGEWVKIPYLSTGADSSINYVEEAPKNGQQYTRKDGAWTVLNIPDDITESINSKVDKVEGKELSSNDFTDAYKTKLDGIAAGAEVNVNADWNAVEGDAQILNKPTLATVATSGQYSDLTGIPSLSNVATSGSYNDLSNKPTIITSDEVDQKINTVVGSVYRVKGTVANYNALPTTNVVVGDVYNLEDTGANYVATSTTPTWNKLSETVDLSAYSTTAQNDEKYQPKGNYSTSFADEEDITVDENNLLKFKDKEYSPKDYSGMGRKVLRKHYVNGINTLTQHMINKPNTIYVIQYDYCLDDQTIEIPENCVLQFEGGSLRNGIITLNKTSIKSKHRCFIDLVIKGSALETVYLSWFLNKTDEDSFIGFNSFIDLYNNSIEEATFIFDVTELHITLPKNFKGFYITRSVDFCNIKVYVKNIHKYSTLFIWSRKDEIQEVEINKDEIDLKNIDFTKYFGRKDVILHLYDNNELVHRLGYEYGAHKSDMIEVASGYFKNQPCTPYNEEEVDLTCYFVETKKEITYIKNITIIRKDSLHVTTAINIEWNSNVVLDNISVYTDIDIENNNIYSDTAIKINNCTSIKVNNLIIKNTYSSKSNSGYGISCNSVYDIQFENIKTTSEWGVFGTNYMNKVAIYNSTINRFDIHCYGKDILFNNVNFYGVENQFSGIVGYIKFDNCVFNENFRPITYEGSYQLYLKHDVIFYNCTWYKTNESYLLNVYNMGSRYNDSARKGYEKKYIPNIYIDNMKVISETNNGSNFIVLHNPWCSNVVIDGYFKLSLKNTILKAPKDKIPTYFTLSDNRMTINRDIIIDFDNVSTDKSLDQGFILPDKKLYAPLNGVVYNNKLITCDKEYINVYNSDFGDNIDSINDRYVNCISSRISGHRQITTSKELIRTYTNCDIILDSIDDPGCIGDANFFNCNIIGLGNIDSIKLYRYLVIINCKTKLNIEGVSDELNANSEYIRDRLKNISVLDQNNIIDYYPHTSLQIAFPDIYQYYINRSGTHFRNERSSGSFNNRPIESQGARVGYSYFCTDKQTSEGGTNGIMIYHKGNNIWVDSLGRVIE